MNIISLINATSDIASSINIGPLIDLSQPCSEAPRTFATHGIFEWWFTPKANNIRSITIDLELLYKVYMQQASNLAINPEIVDLWNSVYSKLSEFATIRSQIMSCTIIGPMCNGLVTKEQLISMIDFNINEIQGFRSAIEGHITENQGLFANFRERFHADFAALRGPVTGAKKLTTLAIELAKKRF